MSNGKHYFVEENADRNSAVRASDSDPAGTPFNNQAEAIHRFAFQSPTSHSEDDRIRGLSRSPGNWRPA